MQASIPSRTALRVALRRAAHQTIDHPVLFHDPLAERILGPHRDQLRAPKRDSSRTLRAFLVARSRYAEDLLAHAVQRGVRQHVLLGAGLDTFAYRNPYAGLQVFEVDHPATQAWKLDLLASTSIAVPASVTHVAVDFEHQSLDLCLQQQGFDPTLPTFFGWLGVTPYLTADAFWKTLHYLAQQAPKSGFVMDYAIPPESMSPLERMQFESLAARVAQAGEPFQLFFTPETLHQQLCEAGFQNIEDLDGSAINTRYFEQRSDAMKVHSVSAHFLSAWLRG